MYNNRGDGIIGRLGRDAAADTDTSFPIRRLLYTVVFEPLDREKEYADRVQKHKLKII